MPEHRVLLVDDDRTIIQALAVRLRALGYDVLTAFDGNSGLALALREQPDAVVLDIRMPGLDGLTVLDRLRDHSATRDLPVIMLSASIVNEHEALDRGASFFLQKPYDAAALIAALQAAIQNRTGARRCLPNES